MRLPEIGRQRRDAGEQQVGILDRAVVEVVLRVDAEDRRLDAQVDVLGHQRDAHRRHLHLQRQRVAEQRVVDALAGQRVRQPGRQAAGLEEEPAGGRLLAVIAGAPGRQLEAAVDLVLGGVRHQLVEEAADLAHVARRFGQALLAGVELLQHPHRHEDVVLLEAEDRGGIVHQHVRVQHERAPRALGGA